MQCAYSVVLRASEIFLTWVLVTLLLVAMGRSPNWEAGSGESGRVVVGGGEEMTSWGVRAASLGTRAAHNQGPEPDTKSKLEGGGSGGNTSWATGERAAVVRVLQKLQRRAEGLEGIQHTLEEEASVDEFFENDIRLTVDQAEMIEDDMKRRRRRKLAEPLAKRWSLPIPYVFDGSHSSIEKHRIKLALAYWEELTCIKFREEPLFRGEKLLFLKGSGCWSYVGYTHQVNQTVSIGDGCQSNGTIAHEVGHAIGFWHEQSRPDRDRHIVIHSRNISTGKLYNFAPRTWGEIVTLSVPYDLGSDMHYGSKFYAIDPNSTLTTVETRDPLMSRVIGQRQELSFYDVKLANKAYCDGVCSSYGHPRLAEPCQRDGYQDPINCFRCRCPDGFGGAYCQAVAPGVNAYCGGVLDARYNGTVYSPGYPAPGYHSDIQCSWLIQAPTGTRVQLEFLGRFGIAGHTDVCKDFVEVRYGTSLSMTGARFCCHDPPTHPLTSSTNEMLVIFRSYRESRVCDDLKYPWKCKQVFTGFKAKYYMTPCGGCRNYGVPEQPACARRKSYTCAQSWQDHVKIECPKWRYWGTTGMDSCGVRTVTRIRYSRCTRDELYCCDRYTLVGKVCKPEGFSQMRSHRPLPPPSLAGLVGSPETLLADDTSEHVAPPGGGRPPLAVPRPQSPGPAPVGPSWSDWGDWTPCNSSCGGGTSARYRTCLRLEICGTMGRQEDKRYCAAQPCRRVCPYQQRVSCGPWKTCTRTVYRECASYCRSGWLLHAGRCVLHTSS